MTTLIFDCDGVLADTERYGHLPAFNQTFEEFGLPVRWSEAEYAEKLRIGGGKERMASLLTPEFVAATGLPSDSAGQQDAVAMWHRRKTQIYTAMVAAGRLPGRPGVARIAADAHAAGWHLAVASTSAEVSVRAVLQHVVGAGLASAFSVFAGDIVASKKPAPDIYDLAVATMNAIGADTLVIEDSRNGLLAATAAGLNCLVTLNGYTADEDFAEAAMVVTCLGDPDGEHPTVLANRTSAAPGDVLQLADLDACLPAFRPSRTGARMPTASQDDVDVIVRTVAQTAVDNERYFGELDAVVGDGDFGYSMARGFESVLTGWDSFDRADIGTFLKKVAIVITGKIGGTSGPIWGTAFLRAGGVAAGRKEIDGATAVAMLRSAVQGIQARGSAELGDKTLLDVLIPVTEALDQQVTAGADGGTMVRELAVVARERAEATRSMQARRGRASYTGERSIGSLDAGAVAVAVILEQLAMSWPERAAST